MDRTNGDAQLQAHISKLSTHATNLKMVAWCMFDYEWEKGRSAYLGKLLAEMGKQCDVVTKATEKIVTLGGLVSEELEKWEGKE